MAERIKGYRFSHGFKKQYKTLPLGIRVLLRTFWILGLRYAAPGMKGIPSSWQKKLDNRVISSDR